jgi:hypothetical protein
MYTHARAHKGRPGVDLEKGGAEISTPLRTVTKSRSFAGVTIRWFTDADRQDMLNAEEERWVLRELEDKYMPMHVMTAEERDVAVADFRKHEKIMNTLMIDSNRRS